MTSALQPEPTVADLAADALAAARLDDDGAPAGPTGSVRLRLAPVRYRGSMDGAWWPSDRSLDELAALIAELTRCIGPVHRVSLNPSRWPETPRRLRLASGPELRIGWFPHMDADLIAIGQGNHDALLLLVIPPRTSPARAAGLLHRVGADPVTVPAAVLLAAEPPAAPQPRRGLDGAG